MFRKLIPNKGTAGPSTGRGCTRCGKQLGIVEGLTSGERMRCRECSRAVKDQLQEWRRQFLDATRDGLLSIAEWHQLQQQVADGAIDLEEAIEFIRKDALTLLERSMAFAKADGQLDDEEEQQIRWLISTLALGSIAPHIIQELDYLSRIRRIRAGDIATMKASIILPAGELCYFECSATYRKINRSSVTELPGRLIVTNRRLVFSAPSGGGEVPLGKVLDVKWHAGGIFLDLSRKANSGYYTVNFPQVIAEITLSAARMVNRQLIAPGDRDTRRIPQDIKVAVWQRDQGRCVQCGASEYLEFDHVIPHSKGGATSVKNLQLLCRKCNSEKRDNL